MVGDRNENESAAFYNKWEKSLITWINSLMYIYAFPLNRVFVLSPEFDRPHIFLFPYKFLVR